MIYVLVIALVALLAMVVVSLFRGLNAFRQSIDVDPEAAKALQLKQNQMMWARIKYQALAVIVVGILLAFARN